MLVRAQIVYNALTLLAINHISVKAPWRLVVKSPDPRDRLAAQIVYKSVVFNRERNVLSFLRKHNPAPSPNIQKRESVKSAMPNLIHNSFADAGNTILTAETKALLYFRMKSLEV